MHTPSEKITSSVDNFDKTSAGSVATSSKKRQSVDKTTPRSSRTKISAVGRVTGKSADEWSARRFVTGPQDASHSEKSSSNSKQKVAAGQHHSTVLDSSPSSSRKTSDSLTKTSGRLGANKATGSNVAEGGTDRRSLKPTEMTLELKGKGAEQESSVKVISARQKVSEKKPTTSTTTSARADSRPASRLAVYVTYITTNCCYTCFTITHIVRPLIIIIINK